MPVEFTSFRAERLRQVHQRLAAQPNWVLRAAAMTFAVVVLLPILLLVTIAFALSLVVFGVLGLVNRIGGTLAGRSGALWRRDGQGRRNVTIIPRES
jgi:hypothetical protein